MNDRMEDCTHCLTRKEFMNMVGEVAVGSVVVTAGMVSTMHSSASAESLNRGVETKMHRKEIIKFQRWCRPIIEECLGADNYDRFCRAALSEYDRFSSTLPSFEDDMNNSLFYANCPWMLSNYRALLGEFELGREEALANLRRISNFKHHKKFENQSMIMNWIFPRIANYDFLKNAALKRFLVKKDETFGWAAALPESDAYIAVDYTKCGLTDWFRDQGAPEIASIACEGDHIQFALWKGLNFVRTKTIANGDGICDMRFYKADTIKQSDS
jgi:hypothetical protein